GHVLYAVVGTGKGRVAVPPGVLTPGAGNTVRANVAQQKLASAPQISGKIDQPGQLGQANFVTQVYQHFGQVPWWQGNVSFPNAVTVSQLEGANVTSAENQSLGKVHNLGVDLPSGRIPYVILTPASSLNLGNNLYVLPPEALSVGANGKTLTSTINQAKLAGGPHFQNQSGGWRALSQPAFASQVYQYYGTQPYSPSGGGGTAMQAGGQTNQFQTPSMQPGQPVQQPPQAAVGGAAAGAGSLSQAAPANQLVGKQVLSSDNQPVGTLDNLVVDLESGHILYAVVGSPKGKVAVPPGLFTQATGNNLSANVDAQKLQNAPQFTSSVDQPQAMSQASFVSQVYQYFGQPAWWQGSAPVSEGAFHNVHKATELPGLKVQNVSNQPVAQVNGSVLDLPAGRVLYVILAPDPSLNLGNNLYALPPDALTLSSDQKNLVSNIDRQKLAGAPSFSQNNWAQLNNPAFASQVYQYYGKQAYFQTGGALQPTGRTNEWSYPQNTNR
ncbi:MAG TPA: PRC-barrel domain-containing protein, partial [Candidatus Sulfotelmatobacter sp.]|nr:PRC-barrel domain-containing protein [Candidatus Sulfotelmatobacter sp.]